uniref:Expressed protein n=1 Tax=Echinococcus granulosus TaxID=6210 RepID=A0A068WQE3_ECHGR|nr:expressed protein [Echinococcus granulosus]
MLCLVTSFPSAVPVCMRTCVCMCSCPLLLILYTWSAYLVPFSLPLCLYTHLHIRFLPPFPSLAIPRFLTHPLFLPTSLYVADKKEPSAMPRRASLRQMLLIVLLQELH